MNEHNPLKARDAHIWTLRILCVLLGLITLVAIAALQNVPNEIKVRIPPDYANGVLLDQSAYPKSAIYANAYLILQNLQHWKDSAETDYPANVKKFECYMYPEMKTWLMNDLSSKRVSGELRDRKRFPRLAGTYGQNSVTPVGNGVWHVWIDVQYTDYLHDEPFKTSTVRYPLIVATDERACNPLGISIKGLFTQVRRIDTEIKNTGLEVKL